MSSMELPAGAWFGSFAYAFDPENRQPTELSLERKGNELRGSGQDAAGKYKIEGTVEPSSGKVRWLKKYREPGTAVAYVGTWDGAAGELAGRWRIVNTEVHGRFSLKPGAAPKGIDVAEPTPTAIAAKLADRFKEKCGIDLDALRFDGERDMLLELLADPDYLTAIDGATARAEVNAQAKGTSPHRARLERAITPRVFEALDRCVEALKLELPVALYVENDGSLNACVLPPSDSGIEIILTSGAINVLDVEEMAYVLGHEIGHALLGHHATFVGDASQLSGVTNLRRLALARYQELSADRVGLLACPNTAKVVRAEFMLHTGISAEGVVGSADAILEAARQAIAKANEISTEDALEANYATHPYGPMRTLAIEWFARSTTFHELRKVAGGELSEAELEQRVAEIVSVMNPSCFGATTKQEEIVELVALAALAVADAEGGISKKEARAIKGMGPEVEAAFEAAKKLSLEEQQLRCLELAEKLELTLSGAQRQRVVEDLVTIAQVDGKISEPEQIALSGIATLLGVPPMDALGVLDEINGGLD